MFFCFFLRCTKTNRIFSPGHKKNEWTSEGGMWQRLSDDLSKTLELQCKHQFPSNKTFYTYFYLFVFILHIRFHLIAQHCCLSLILWFDPIAASLLPDWTLNEQYERNNLKR